MKILFSIIGLFLGSDSSRTQLRIIEESTLGAVPASAFTNLRFTGESLKYNIENDKSEEIRSDRQITDVIQMSANANGGFDGELSYNTFDMLLDAMMYSAWATELTVTATDISAATTDDSFNSVAAGFPAFLPGSWIEVRGFTGSVNNNGYFQVLSRTASKVTVNANLVDDAAGESVTIKTTTVRNEVTRTSFSLEKEFSDKAEFRVYKGMVVNGVNLGFEAGKKIPCGFTFMGVGFSAAQATAGTGAHVAAPTTEILNAANQVGNIYEGGTLVSGINIQKIGMSINNNLRNINAIGSLGPVDMGAGRFSLEGSFTAYLEDDALIDKFTGDTASSLAWKVEDAAGNAYIFNIPNLKFIDVNEQVKGADQDVLVECQFQAIRHVAYDMTFEINKFAA